MKKSLMIIPLVILLCFTFSCQAYEEKPTVDIEADVEAIKSLTEKVMKAFNEGDLEAFMATVAEDAVWMPAGEPVIIGKEAIRNWYNEVFDKISYDVTISSDEIEICGDWAIQRATWKGSWIQKDSGETTQFESKDIYIHRRQPDGSWKNSHTIWNFTSMETREN